MSDDLFERRCAVIVDAQRWEGLRVSFKVEKSTRKEPNTLELSITNLSSTSRAAMQKKGAKVRLFAGYADNMPQLFVGDARTIDHVREGADWITKISCGDGERAFEHAFVSESWGPGTKVSTVLAYLTNALGVGVGNAIEKTAQLKGPLQTFASGYAVHNYASTELDRLMRAVRLQWSIQDGNVQVLEPGTAAKVFAPLISPDSGLIGSPEHGTAEKKEKAVDEDGEYSIKKESKKGAVLKVKSLLNARVHAGGPVIIKSANVDARYRAEKVTHEGDTAGGAWHTLIEAKPL